MRTFIVLVVWALYVVCYDGFFPDVARELSNRSAEVIAWPVWGCNPMLGASL